MWLIDGSGLLMCEWNWFAIKRVQMGKHWNGCHGNWQSKSINQSMNNTENVIFSRRSFVTDVNSQSANRKTLLFVCAIFINCLIYKLHCDMKRAWLSTSEFLVQSKINFNHISDRVAKLAMKWILVVLVCHCERCSVYVLCDGTPRVCVFVWECISLVAFAGNQLSFKLTRFCANVSSCVWWVLSGWHAKTWLPYKQYQSFPFGCHFSSATAATTMKINSHHAIWQLKIQTVCYQCVEYIYAKKPHLLGLSVWW